MTLFYQILVSSTLLKAYSHMDFNGFVASSVCIQKIMVHTNNI